MASQLSSGERSFLVFHACHTVDGRNPAPPGIYKPCESWDKQPIINWCRISSINSMILKFLMANISPRCVDFFEILVSQNHELQQSLFWMGFCLVTLNI